MCVLVPNDASRKEEEEEEKKFLFSLGFKCNDTIAIRLWLVDISQRKPGSREGKNNHSKRHNRIACSLLRTNGMSRRYFFISLSIVCIYFLLSKHKLLKVINDFFLFFLSLYELLSRKVNILPLHVPP